MLEKLLRRGNALAERIDDECTICSLSKGEIIRSDEDLYLRIGPILEGKPIDIPLPMFSSISRGRSVPYDHDDQGICSTINLDVFGNYKIITRPKDAEFPKMRTRFDREESRLIREHIGNMYKEEVQRYRNGE